MSYSVLLSAISYSVLLSAISYSVLLSPISYSVLLSPISYSVLLSPISCSVLLSPISYSVCCQLYHIACLCQLYHMKFWKLISWAIWYSIYANYIYSAIGHSVCLSTIVWVKRLHEIFYEIDFQRMFYLCKCRNIFNGLNIIHIIKT